MEVLRKFRGIKPLGLPALNPVTPENPRDSLALLTQKLKLFSFIDQDYHTARVEVEPGLSFFGVVRPLFFST